MDRSVDLKKIAEIDRQADESGLAISFIDASRQEIHTSNNNSICHELNPGPGFSTDCDKYCGAAFERVIASGGVAEYRCHAGLDCRAVSFQTGQSTLAAVVGRAFTDTSEYKKATERAISGDWSRFSPNELFDNVLISGSSRQLEEAVSELGKLEVEAEPSPKRPDPTDLPPISQNEDTDAVTRILAESAAEQLPTIESSGPIGSRNRTAEITEWRSFFGSLLDLDYADASLATLEFLSKHLGLRSLVWLKRNGNRLENSTALGKIKGKRLRIAIASGDKRLLQALADGVPLELGERPKGRPQEHARKMSLFPIGIGGEISAAVAVLDPVDNTHREKIVRVCRSIAQQFEILRLRSEVVRGDSLTTAVRRFSETLKSIENEDLWMSLTQNAAEILKAERSSMLVFDEKSGQFQTKAMLGTEKSFEGDDAIGERIAKHVFTTQRAIAVEDISKAGILPDTESRHYKTPSFLSSPISVGGRVIGVMNFADRASGEPFDKSSLELFEAIAPQIGIAIDRAELREKAGQFEQLSVTDSLTGLLNRRYMEERLTEETKRSNRHGYPMSFMMLDVDEFKSYNDHFGHPAGDEALKLVGNIIRETLRGADVAARFGGEEFAVLLPQTTDKEAWTIAERIRSNIEQTRFPERPVTISIGISSCSAELCRDADLVSAADQALYRAKRSGRNRVLAFEDKVNTQ